MSGERFIHPLPPAGYSPCLRGRKWVIALAVIRSFQHFLQVGCRVAYAGLYHLLGCAGEEYLSATAASFGTHLYDVVGSLDDVQVVLHDDHGVALVHKAVQHGEEHADVLEVQTSGGLVQYI